MSEQVFHFFPCRGNMSCWLCTPHGCNKRDGCPNERHLQRKRDAARKANGLGFSIEVQDDRAELETQLRAAGDSEEEIAEVLRGYDCHYWEDVLRREASAGEQT